MSRSQLVAEHLPLLRRYARALTGNQASGDAYVGAMLEALLQDPSLLDERHGARVGLFRLFTQIWNSVSLNDKSEAPPVASPSERRLSNITPLPRQAFLLLSLEERKRAESGYPMGEEEKRVFREKMIARYEAEAHPFFCAARLLNDGVLKFGEIRDWLAMAFEVSLLKPVEDSCFGGFRF